MQQQAAGITAVRGSGGLTLSPQQQQQQQQPDPAHWTAAPPTTRAPHPGRTGQHWGQTTNRTTVLRKIHKTQNGHQVFTSRFLVFILFIYCFCKILKLLVTKRTLRTDDHWEKKGSREKKSSVESSTLQVLLIGAFEKKKSAFTKITRKESKIAFRREV